MKKKVISLLLVVALLTGIVSVCFSSMFTEASPAGRGIESINAFSLVDSKESMAGTSYSSTITVKSKVSGYKIKVKSISAVLPFYTSTETRSFSVSYSSGTVCTTSGTNFSVSGSIDAGRGSVIRYTCTYDLLNDAGTTLYSNMTGYGYGYAGGSSAVSGAVGSAKGNPGKRDTDCSMNWINQLNSCYVNPGAFSLGYETYTARWDGGGGNQPTVYSGSAPAGFTFSRIEWCDRGNESEGSSRSGTWCSYSPAGVSGYYVFSVNLYGSDRWDDHTNAETTVSMYIRTDSDKSGALSQANSYLNMGYEKSYYSVGTWNNYLAALDRAQNAGRAIAYPNYGFQVACSYAANSKNATDLNSTRNALFEEGADYTGFNNAVAAFNSKKTTSVSVMTYFAGATSTGTTTATKYSSSAINSVQSYINGCSLTMKVCDQSTVDGYVNEINSRTNNLAEAGAVYTYLDIAISEFEATSKGLYSESSWAMYMTRYNEAKNVSRSLTTGSQSTVNNALSRLVTAKNSLDLASADYTKVNVQISVAEGLIAEYGEDGTAGNLETGADGFAEAWEAFKSAYSTAKVTLTYKIDRQADVDTAAKNLEKAIADLNVYRFLNTTELAAATAKMPQFSKDYYDASSYDSWNSIRREGIMFLTYADPSYEGANRKTYADYDEMVWITSLVNSAYDSLELKKADFTKVSEAVALVPDDDVLMLYWDIYVETIKDLLASIDYGATFLEQEDVDAIADDLEAAVGELVPAHYKDADYTEVDKAIEAVNALDRTLYVSCDPADNAVKAVDRTKKIVDQKDVDAMAKAIYNAIDSLVYLLADYTEVDKAIGEAQAIPHPEYYKNFANVENAINNVDRNQPIIAQDVVDAYAAAIRDAISILALADADYTDVRAAIDEADLLQPWSDFTDATISNLDTAINAVEEGYTVDRQDEVDAMAARIRQAIKDLVLLPANFAKADEAIEFVENTVVRDNFVDLTELDNAINAIDRTLNCRQQDVLAAQVQAVYDAVSKLQLKPADYTEVNEAITTARYTYENGAYPYSQETIDAVENAIADIDWDKNITQQDVVNGYKTAIDNAVLGLTYIPADYTAVDEQLAIYNDLDRTMYVSLEALDGAVLAVDRSLKIDKQDEVDAMALAIETQLGLLEYGPADYTEVDNAITVYESLNRTFYAQADLTPVDIAVGKVVRGYTVDKQSEVDTMAANINDALRLLATKIKDADLTELTQAVNDAKAELLKMSNTGHTIDVATSGPLYTLIEEAEGYQDAKISAQEEIDDLTKQIIDATEALEYVFDVELDQSLIVAGDLIYGFEEAMTTEDAEALISYVGDAELVITETRNGFGTGALIQFINSKGTVLLSYTVVVFGDANGDAVIDMFDVAYCSEVANTGVEVSEAIQTAIDLDGDGYVDTIDVGIMVSLANMDNTILQDGSLEVI